MRPRFRVPLFAVAAALLGLIAVLATLQYRWLGRISDAERERMTSNLRSHATALAHDFDRELTRAYLAFQLDPASETENVASRLTQRYERWTATARHPRMVGQVYVTTLRDNDAPALQRFDPASRFVEPVEWPPELERIRKAIGHQEGMTRPGEMVVIRSMPASVWEEIPALVVPAPLVFLSERIAAAGAKTAFRSRHATLFTIVVLDREYVRSEMLPALVQQQFRGTGSDADYQVAVMGRAGQEVVYQSTPAFAPDVNAPVDASADFFQVRLQEFNALATEVRKFTATTTFAHPNMAGRGRETATHVVPGEGSPVSIMVQQEAGPRTMMTSGVATRTAAGGGARWRLVVKHPSGSLEAAVNVARRRNLVVSSSVLALLGISVGFLVVTTRRAQELARQQMEFVAAVSHELRTPLAVIRSAADNLAEGVILEDDQVRRYGELVRSEGRRLTEMVEQILELAGIHSGQRSFALRPVPIAPLLDDVLQASDTLVTGAGITVAMDVAEGLPPALGDEPALRRVFQNLVSNAIKYGAPGGWIGITARSSGKELIVTVADRGIGIPASEQTRIFDPFYRAPAAVAAQIQGAGLGLSLVQRIVEAHGGRITVRSAEGAGSEFAVHLPTASGEPVARGAAAPGTASVQTQP